MSETVDLKVRRPRAENGTVIAAVAEFSLKPEIHDWIQNTHLKPLTIKNYVRLFWLFLDGEDPSSFLKRALDPTLTRATLMKINDRLLELAKRGGRQAQVIKAAVQSFLDRNVVAIEIKQRIPIEESRDKTYLTWETAERIISKCKQPYEDTFRFMLWAGIGCDEVVEINSRGNKRQTAQQIQEDIQKQLAENKEYITIYMEPRKKTFKRYYIVVPREFIPHFPVKTIGMGERGNTLMRAKALCEYFKDAANRAGEYKLGMGPHTLRSAFQSQCDRLGVREDVSEFVMGHGGGKYGYSRNVLDPNYIISELKKLKHPEATLEKDKRISELEEIVRTLKEDYDGRQTGQFGGAQQ